MRKFTFKKLYVMTAVMLFTLGAFAQELPQEGLTMLPYDGATPDMPISLVLDVRATCPDSSLFNADSVMMHSGVAVDTLTWQYVVDFDAMGANGQQAKLIPFGPGAQVGNITMTPISVYDQVNVVVWPDWTCPAGGLDGADSVMMHSGLEINGEAWQKVVDFDGVGADGQRPKMVPIEYNGQSGWMFSYIPADFYGVEEGDTVTAINCVFNAGSWDAGEGKDINHDGSCTDFRLQFSNGMPYKYSITLVPNDFYPITEGDVISAINCVFNAGSWDAGEGKAHVDDSEDCTDFTVPMGYTSVFENKEAHTFKLYPNPVGDILNISNLLDVNRIEILDVSGRVILAEEAVTDRVSLNVSQLTNGMYIVSYHTSDGIKTSKFIKE